MFTVLIADDEPRFAELARTTLEDDRVRVVDAPDAPSALALAGALRPDVVLLGADLAHGVDVCRCLGRDPELARTAVVMLARAERPAALARGLAAGARHCLTKPVSPVRLLALVESLLSRPAATLSEPAIARSLRRPCHDAPACPACRE
ncbi:MAG TPA: response regulator [Candidatus Tectomicrobia bacterium]|nr:response regulator [Candidatus Tectomicrobia bacterium]